MTSTRAPRRPAVDLSPRTCRALHVVAAVWSVGMALLVLAARRVDLLDARIGAEAFEIGVTPLLIALHIVGALLTLRWMILGGILAAISAAGLSAFALGLLERPSALLVLTGFAVPGALWLLLDLHQRRPAIAVVAVVVVAASVVIGTKVSANVYDGIYGASHPASTTALLPDSPVLWQWSGGVTSDEATVVAKLRRPAAVARLIISDRDDLSDPQATASVVADEHGVVQLPVSGLRPATQYHYALAVDGTIDRARVGRLRTHAEGPHSFTVAVSGCARVGSNGAVFDAIRELDPDLYLINGDWHYANLTGNDPEAFREVMDLTLTRPAQAALYRSTPVAYVWDDHDYGGNNADRRSPTRPAAMAVYREYVPHYPLRSGDSPVNQAFSIGRVRFLVTDTRSARSPASASDDADKTMLGGEQKAWFKRELLRADTDAALTVWVNPTPWVGEATAGADTWAGYSTERRELADFIADNAIDRLLMVSGDAHMLALDDGTNTDYSASGAGGFPLLHAAALDRPGKVKGGPYSLGVVPGGGQFGVLEVDDRGDSLHVRLTGRNWRGEQLLDHEFDVPASHASVGGVRDPRSSLD